MPPKINLDAEELVYIAPSAALCRKTKADIARMLEEATADADPGNMFMRLFFLLTTLGEDSLALDMQAEALKHREVFRVSNPPNPKIKLLAIMGPGDMRDNTPIDYLLENSAIRLDLLFITEEHELPSSLPEHDVAMVALGESDSNNPLLAKIAHLLVEWPRPILNHPSNILNCARPTAVERLQTIPGLLIPKTRRLPREQLKDLTYPCTIRPIDTHGGTGLEKLAHQQALADYLSTQTVNEFYVAEYIDYQSKDGLYRKLRIVLIDGQPFIAHLAIAEHWIVHYISADMENNAQKRAEEQQVMQCFEQDFALRHQQALSAIAARLTLDYVVLDCGETKDGRLLLFEADNRGLIHAADSVEIFPYKPAIMQKAFTAFTTLLQKRAMLY